MQNTREHGTLSLKTVTSLNDFRAHLSLHKSKLTVDAYCKDVEQFLIYLGTRIRSPKGLKGTHITEYLGHCKQQGKSDASINRYYMAIRSFCLYLEDNKTLEKNIAQGIKAPRAILKAPYIPSKDEIDMLLCMPDVSTEAGRRDRGILTLLYSSALRASELCNVKLEDFQEDGVVVRCGKRSKTRTIPITLEAALALNCYIELYRGKEAGYLFQTEQGKRITRQYLCKIIVKYAKQAGIKHITTHTLRHACATHLLDEGADLRLIQEVLGHSSIASTQRYTHLSSNKMQAMFKQFHPRGK